MSFRTGLLKSVERIRGRVPGKLDLRQYVVTVRVRTWTGARPGVGTATDVDTVIYNAGYNVKVEQISQKDVIASGGKYTDQDVKVGPITPDYPGGGTSVSTLDPATTSTAREIFWHIVGPGINGWYKKVGDETQKNFHYYVILRATAQVP